MRKVSQNIWHLLKSTFEEFNNDNCVKLSAALSYYTVFSLPPLLMIVIGVCGWFFGADAVRGEVFSQINGLVGNSAALQIQEMLINVKSYNEDKFTAAVGIVILIIGASGVFAEIQDWINYIWGIKPKPKKGLLKFLKNRLMSFSMIGSVGFLLLVSLIINSVMDLMSNKLSLYFHDNIIYLFYFLNIGIVFVIITLLFTLIFKTLPDGRIALLDCFIGASFTAVLFMIGRFIIGLYLGRSAVATLYGAAGSIILIFVWVYYSAIILYFGAEFTKVYASLHGNKIVPNEYSVRIEKDIHEVGKPSKKTI